MPGRPARPFDYDQFCDTILTVEVEEKPNNRSALFASIGAKLGVSSAYVASKIKEHNIPLSTPIGQRGRKAGVKLTPKAEDENVISVPVEKVKRKYSYKQIVKRHCIKCAGGNPDKKLSAEVRANIRTCHITDCDIHPVRPLKTAEEKRRFSLSVIDTRPDSVSMEEDDTPSVLVPDTSVWDFPTNESE